MSAGLVSRAREMRTEAAELEQRAQKLRHAADVLHPLKSWIRPRGPAPRGRVLLKQSGMTYRVAASTLGCTVRKLDNVLSGRTKSRPLLEKLANLLCVSLEEVSAPLEVTG